MQDQPLAPSFLFVVCCSYLICILIHFIYQSSFILWQIMAYIAMVNISTYSKEQISMEGWYRGMQIPCPLIFEPQVPCPLFFLAFVPCPLFVGVKILSLVYQRGRGEGVVGEVIMENILSLVFLPYVPCPLFFPCPLSLNFQAPCPLSLDLYHPPLHGLSLIPERVQFVHMQYC